MTIDDLVKLGACREAMDFVASQPDWRTAVTRCERLDWPEWLLGRVQGPALVEYQRVQGPALVEYERVCLEHAKRIVAEL
jgi:hypothetical protein